MAVAVLVPTGTAGGSATSGGGAPSFCERAADLVDALGELPRIDLDRAAQRRRFFRRLDRIVDDLEEQAPARLRSAFRTLRPVYDLIADDPANVRLLISEPKARRALARLTRYGERNCGLALPAL